jgi:hypothetical protein
VRIDRLRAPSASPSQDPSSELSREHSEEPSRSPSCAPSHLGSGDPRVPWPVPARHSRLVLRHLTIRAPSCRGNLRKNPVSRQVVRLPPLGRRHPVIPLLVDRLRLPATLQLEDPRLHQAIPLPEDPRHHLVTPRQAGHEKSQVFGFRGEYGRKAET